MLDREKLKVKILGKEKHTIINAKLHRILLYIFIARFKKNGQVIECSLGHQQHLSLLPALNAVAPLPAVIIVDLLEVSMCSPLSVLTSQPDVEAGVVPPTSSESLLLLPKNGYKKEEKLTSSVLISAVHFSAVVIVPVPEQSLSERNIFCVSYLVLNLIPSRL